MTTNLAYKLCLNCTCYTHAFQSGILIAPWLAPGYCLRTLPSVHWQRREESHMGGCELRPSG